MTDVFRMNPQENDAKVLAKVREIKLNAQELLYAMESQNQIADPRYMALAKTHLENSIMWFTKAVTK
jgi:hypothetical protein